MQQLNYNDMLQQVTCIQGEPHSVNLNYVTAGDNNSREATFNHKTVNLNYVTAGGMYSRGATLNHKTVILIIASCYSR